MGTPINKILKNAGWSNSGTFVKHYDKVIIPDVDVLNSLLR